MGCGWWMCCHDGHILLSPSAWHWETSAKEDAAHPQDVPAVTWPAVSYWSPCIFFVCKYPKCTIIRCKRTPCKHEFVHRAADWVMIRLTAAPCDYPQSLAWRIPAWNKAMHLKWILSNACILVAVLWYLHRSGFICMCQWRHVLHAYGTDLRNHTPKHAHVTPHIPISPCGSQHLPPWYLEALCRSNHFLFTT